MPNRVRGYGVSGAVAAVHGAGPLYLQNLTFCPSDPVLGFVFSPMHTVFVGSV